MSHLQQFVSSHQAKAARAMAQSINWYLWKKKWLDELHTLNNQIREWLVVAGVPADQIHATHTVLTEENLGQYQADGLKIKIGLGEVVFTPIASVIIGGHGRVDVEGSRGDAKLIAQDLPFDCTFATPK